MRTPRRLCDVVLVILGVSIPGGCTRIVISDAASLGREDAARSIDYVFLRPVILKPALATLPLSAHTEGFGIVGGGLANNGVTVGWRREQVILLSSAEDCRVVIFVDANTSTDILRDALASCPQPEGRVCISQ